MKRIFISMIGIITCMNLMAQTPVSFYPQENAQDINIDTHLVIVFDKTVTTGSKGIITVTDKTTRNVVDRIDMSIPAGPTEGQPKNAVIARLPDNKGRNYPDAECVLLNCTLDGVPSEGFGPIYESASTANLLEFNSHDKEGKTIDISKRNKHVRQLDAIKDAETIGKYSNVSWFLNW